MHQDEDPADIKRRQAGNARRDGWENKAKSRLKEFEKLISATSHTAINSRSSHSALSRKCCISQTSYTVINSRSSFSSFSRFSKMVGFNLTAATVTIHCLKLCCFIMQFDTVIGYMRKKPQHGVKRVCKFLKWSVSF